MKTRAEWNEIVLHEARGLLEHISSKRVRKPAELMAIAKAACAQFIKGRNFKDEPWTTHDCMMLVACLLQLVRELGVEADMEEGESN